MDSPSGWEEPESHIAKKGAYSFANNQTSPAPGVRRWMSHKVTPGSELEPSVQRVGWVRTGYRVPPGNCKLSTLPPYLPHHGLK